ncbi:MAG TPA: SOS response-associated peptidase family protein [Desulfosporosinus sp.]|nr:SOS response-associated peptidase family protein [Desulfosporosinus sp.]
MEENNRSIEFNARVETLDEKPSFKTCLQRRCCLIIADGFYEWKKEGRAKRPNCTR